jgi:hypothetical protein
MVKMIARGLEVTGLESQKIVMGGNLRGVHRNPKIKD